MAKFEDRENRRKTSVVSSMVDHTPEAGKRGRPKEDRETKKRVSLSVLPSLYEDIQKIAYVQRKSTSEIMSSMMEAYRSSHAKELAEYEELQK